MKYLLYNYIAVSIVSLCLQAAGRAETSGGERHDYCRNSESNTRCSAGGRMCDIKR